MNTEATFKRRTALSGWEGQQRKGTMEANYTTSDLVKRVIGPISPVGESHTDEKRYQNLEHMIEVVNRLLYEIWRVSENKNRVEFSMKKAGQTAYEFLKDVKEEY